MAWRETERSKAVVVRSRYRCTDCGHEFVWRHEGENDDPVCPMCPAEVAEGPSEKPKVEWQPPRPAIGTVKSRAIDYTQAMVEQQFGLPDFNDNQRVGDIGYKPPPPMQTAERESAMREMLEAGIPEETSKQITDAAANFWQGNMGGASTEQTLGQQGVAAQASAAAKAAGVDPIGMLEAGREKGILRPGGYSVAAAVEA